MTRTCPRCDAVMRRSEQPDRADYWECPNAVCHVVAMYVPPRVKA